MRPIFLKRSCPMFAAAVLALAAASAASAAPPAVLSELPADAKFVIVINNLKDLNTKVGKAVAKLNLPAVPPDLLGYLTRKGQIDKGFDANSSAAAVMLPIDGDDGKPALVVLLPTTDPKAMLAQFQPTDPDKSGIMEVTPPDGSDEKSYAAVVGKWVAISPGRSTLESYMGRKASLAKTLPAETLKIFEANDLVVWANMAALRKDADMALESGEQLLKMGMAQTADRAGADPATLALQKAVFNEYFLGLKEFCKDATSGIVTLRMTDDGPTLGEVGTFKPDSPFGKFVAAQKGAPAATLQGLPAGNFLGAMAMNWDPGSMTDVVDAASKRFLSDEGIAKDPKIDDYRKIAEQYVALSAITNGGSMVFLEPPGGLGAGAKWLNGAMLTHTSDPAKYIAMQLELVRGPIGKISVNADIQPSVTVTENAQTISGVKLDQIQMDWKLRQATDDKPLAPGSQEAIDMLHKLYGAQGVTIHVGVVGSNVLSVFGSDADTLKAAVAAAQSNSDALSKTPLIAGSKDHVLPGAIGVAYLPMARWIGIAESMMPGGGPAGAAPGAGANDAPVVISAAVSGSTLTVETHIPLGTIGAIKDAVMQYMGAMMGGGGAPAPAGPMQ